MEYGVAFVDGKYPNRVAQQDYMVYSATDAAGLGFLGGKWYATPEHATKYPNQAWADTYTNLTDLVQDPAYVTVLGLFDTHYISTFTFANGVNNDWIHEESDDYLDDEYEEMYDFAVHLLSYSNKTFYIQNWEGDWALLGIFDEEAIVPAKRSGRMAAFMRKRQQAITDARNAVPNSTSKIYNAMEVNRVLDDFSDRCHSEVAPFVIPDAISFSLYECINTLYTNDQAASEAEIERRMIEATRRVRAALDADGRNASRRVKLYIGEMGWNEDEASFTSKNLNVGQLIQKVLDVAQSLDFVAAVHWIMYDNEEQSPGVPRGYGIRNTSLVLTAQGTKWVSLL